MDESSGNKRAWEPFPFTFPFPTPRTFKKRRKCSCPLSRMSPMGPSKVYVPRTGKFAKIFSGDNKAVTTVPGPSFSERMEYYLKEFELTPKKRPTSPPIEPPSTHFSESGLPENDETTDLPESDFGSLTGQQELLMIAWQIGIPRPDSVQHAIAMQILEKNTVFLTLSESLKGKKERIREDLSLGPMLEEIQSGGRDVMKRYLNDEDLLSNLGVALGDIDLGNDDRSFTGSIEVSEDKSVQPAGDTKTHDWDDLRAILFVMLFA